jgi:hypothetical protein
MHVLTEANTNATAGYAVDLDTKIRRRLSAYRSPQEFMRVLDRVRIRKRSRSASQTLRLFAWWASDSASSDRHGRIVQLFRTSCIDYF